MVTASQPEAPKRHTHTQKIDATDCDEHPGAGKGKKRRSRDVTKATAGGLDVTHIVSRITKDFKLLFWFLYVNCAKKITLHTKRQLQIFCLGKQTT